MNTPDRHPNLIFEYKIEELVKDNPRRTVDLLASLLKDTSGANRAYAFDKIKRFADEDALLSSYDFEVREGIRSSHELVDTLISLLSDSESKVRQDVVIILSHYDEERIFPYLVQALEDESLDVRRSALLCFVNNQFRWPGAENAIVQLLNDEDVMIQEWANRAMSKFSIVEAAETS